jgi:spore coat polysaccharide biosynthesis protein SpsF (cytidylyltransferase family)/aryl-alcohol dehydrogenase-like predicted oxidoreductase
VTSRRLRIVLQARTTSSRLPAKALLPVGGLPLAILCARRLASSGREVVLATSDNLSDDLLVSIAGESGIRVYRGSLDDVLGRFLACTADLADGDVVVRATADNPVPDGSFVERLVSTFENLGTEYLGTSSPADGLPYGLSAEVFTAGALRESASEGRDGYVREHVTSELFRKSGAAGIVPRGAFLEDDCSGLRVTIDTLDDYLAMAKLFRRVADPEGVSWRQLIDWMLMPTENAEEIPGRPVDGRRHSCITLGTAQFGFTYGVANRTGRPDEDEARTILGMALEAGVTHLDTARAYGDAEIRIGRLLPKRAGDRLHIVSKLSALADLPDDVSSREVANAVDASVYGSCRDLSRSRIDVMMFHRSADMFRWGGAAIERLATHIARGAVGEIGVSVYTPDEAILSIEDERVTNVQIPFNLLDARWLARDFQDVLAGGPNLKVYARSVFLQGLLLSGSACWPQWAGEAPALVAGINSLVGSLNRKSAADLCVAYVRAFPWVTSLVLDVETATQFRELLALAHEPPLRPEETIIVRHALANASQRLLNPSLW